MPGYTIIVNVLDYTTTTIPVTTADKSIDVVNKDFKPLNEEDEAVWKICEFDEPGAFHNMADNADG